MFHLWWKPAPFTAGEDVTEPLVFPIGYSPAILASAVIVAVGVYVLMIEEGEFFGPLKRITERGPLLALGGAVGIAAATLADNYVVEAVDPFAFAGVLSVGVSLGFLAILHLRTDSPLRNPRNALSRRYVPLGLARVAGLYGIFLTFALTTATRGVVIQQLIPLLTVIGGGVFFAEDNIVTRLIGAAMVVVGVIVIVVF